MNFAITVSVIGIGLTVAASSAAKSPLDGRTAMQATMEARSGVGQAVHGNATDEAAVAALDLAFQQAVKVNDAATIDRILHEHFWLVLGNGTVVTRSELLDEAKSGTVEYDIQDEVPGTQKVRVWGDTAVVTAKLKLKGRQNGEPFSRTLWFSDTYVRTAGGWKYAFAQASLPLPEE